MTNTSINTSMFENEVGKTTFVFRTEIENKDRLREILEDAINRFEVTHDIYKIRVFQTSESIRRNGSTKEVEFLTIKIEGSNFRAVALRMSKVFNYLTLVDYGIRSEQDFEIDKNSSNIYLFKDNKTVSVKGMFRKAQASRAIENL